MKGKVAMGIMQSIPGLEQISRCLTVQLSWDAKHMAHEPIEVHVICKHLVAKSICTKLALAVTILMRHHGLFFKNCEKPQHLLIHVANTVSG